MKKLIIFSTCCTSVEVVSDTGNFLYSDISNRLTILFLTLKMLLGGSLETTP